MTIPLSSMEDKDGAVCSKMCCSVRIDKDAGGRGPGASTKDKRQSRRDNIRRDQTYTKRHRDKLLQGSLENVSINPLGDFGLQESSLRRSRSLAISREDVFTNLEIHGSRRRRSQLIPRAKLIDRYSSKDRSLQRGFSQESIYISDRNLSRRQSSSGVEYLPLQHQTNTQKHSLAHQISEHRDSPFTHLNNFPPPSGEEIDSLDSNYQNKTSLNTLYTVSQDNLSYQDAGLSLPNYYPDSKCDTDLSFTDNVSVNDTVATAEQILSNKNSPFQNRNCNSHQNSLNPGENISYDENIVFTKNTLYDKIAENNYYSKSKPRTIRGNTPYSHENDNYYSGKPRSLPNYATNDAYESDSSLSDYDPQYYEPIENIDNKIVNRDDQNNNFEEISLNDEKVSKVIQNDNEKENVYGSKSDFSNIEANPIYDEIPIITDIATSAKEKEEIKNKINKTSIQVQGEEKEYLQENESENSEEYKTIVSVTDEKSNQSEESEEGSPKEAKKHSHNYLREFLETQKGSKKPLQNFLSKRISRAFNGDKSNKQNKKESSNLVENQYFSLPDITISKSLQKSEKIDRKLRKCDSKLNKSSVETATSTNRFIVNIGNHFDVTARSSVPVDFELKISKIPKLQKSKKSKGLSGDSESHFVDAVRSLKNSFRGKSSKKINKIIVNGEEINTEDLFQRDKEVEVIIEDTNIEKMNGNEVTKEFQEKIHTMRSYWGSIVNDKDNSDKDDDDEKDHKCKIVGMQTKVEEVKKKFEPPEEKELLPNKVQLAKQLFEKKQEKSEKRERRGILENPFFEKDTNNQYESLNSNVLEIIEKSDKTEGNNVITTNNLKPTVFTKNKHRPVMKTRSVSIEPEFDHVRYKVMKSDLFQKKIFANCEKESQFDGLMQYLQDYSFQELLIDNNIVIIEPIRTNVQYVGTSGLKTTRNVTQFIHKPGKPENTNESTGLRKHFFYHPIRVNREVNDDELPNPDTVKQVRQLFEGELTRSQSSKNLENLTKQTVQYRTVDPDKDRCSATDSNSSFGSNENFFESLENEICCDQFVSEDILEKIRQCGTSVTYYGGKVVNKRTGKSVAMTKAIMDEIKNQRRRSECNCRRSSSDKGKNVTFADSNKVSNGEDNYQGIKFKLLKSNSCSSRLELVGTKNLTEYRNKFVTRQKELIREHNLRKQNEKEAKSAINANTKSLVDKNAINENIKEQSENMSPKIIGEEMKACKKLIQWSEMKDDKTYAGITYTKAPQKITYDYHNYEKVKPKAKKLDEMEFEQYEIATNN